MENVTIRKAIVEDAREVSGIFSDPEVFRQTLQLPYPTEGFWRSRLQGNDPTVHSLVLEVDGALKGVGGIHMESRQRLIHKASLGICMRSDCRGKGLGSILMRALLELSDNWLGLRRLELSVFTDNKPAIRLYEKMGFQTEGTLRQYALREGTLQDVFMMARLRDAPGVTHTK